MEELKRDNLALTGENIAATIGMFDGVHLGHRQVISLLNSIANQYGYKSAVITFREHPQLVLRKNTDLKMIMDFEEKMNCIGSLGVDYSIVLNFTRKLASLSAYDFIKMLRDDYGVRILLIGYNHRFGHNRNEGYDDYYRYGEMLGVKLMRAPEYTGEHSPVSSSIIRKLIHSGKVDDAANCMGSFLEISGVVVHGFQNGRKIGFPTANIAPDNDTRIIPRNGVYAVRISISDGAFLNGICNIGTRPTIDQNSQKISIEVHIFNFDEDIYDRHARVEFVSFIRSEIKFESLDRLKEQIVIDSKRALDVLINRNKSKSDGNN